MVLINTSIWIDHFRKTNLELEYLLSEYQAATHPYIIGELACGNFKNRTLILELLSVLPVVPAVSEEEYYLFIEQHELFGKGLGFVDIHLLATAKMAHASLYMKDKNLLSAALRLNVAYSN